MPVIRSSALVTVLAAVTLAVAGCSGGSSSPSAGSTPGGPGSSPATTGGPTAGSTGTSSPAPGSSGGPGKGSKAPGSDSTGHPHASTPPRVPPPKPTIAVSSGDKQDEKYCAVTPATGTLSYSVSGGNATIRLSLGGLPPSTTLAIDWQKSDGTGGYSIGAFQTDGSGNSQQGSLRMFRSPAKAGPQVLIDRADGTHVAQLNRC